MGGRDEASPEVGGQCRGPGCVLVAAAAASAQNKPVVAITGIDVAAQNISCDGWDRSVYNCNQDLAEGFSRMLVTAIQKTGKVTLMERQQLDAILVEQGLGEIGADGRRRPTRRPDGRRLPHVRLRHALRRKAERFPPSADAVVWVGS